MVAFLITALLFIIIPLSNYIGVQKNKSSAQVALENSVAINLPPPKKKKQQQRKKIKKPVKSTRNIKPKAMARSNLSMNLGPGGGNGAVINNQGSDDVMTLKEGEADIDPELIQPAKVPVYPKKAQQAGIGGLVVVEITVNEQGKISKMDFLETPGQYGFEKSIRSALQSWTFKPAKLNGVPVAMRLQYPFEF